MEYHLLLALAREAHNATRCKIRYIEQPGFKEWWETLPKGEQERLAVATGPTLRIAFGRTQKPKEISFRDLRDKASRLGVKYYTYMDRRQLLKHIAEAEKCQTASTTKD